MHRDVFVKQLLSLAVERGCQAAEVCVDQGEHFRVKVLNGQIDAYEVSRQMSVGLRVLYEGKNGYAGTQALEDAPTLVERAMDNASAVELCDEHPMQGAQTYPVVKVPECPLCALSIAEKIELAMQMERMAKAADARVFQTPYCVVTTVRTSRTLNNTLGLFAHMQRSEGAIMLEVAVRDGDETHDGIAFREGAQAMDVEACVQEAVQKAVDCFGARSVQAMQTPVVLDREAAADLLEAFSGMFCADQAQRGLSPLAGRCGQRIAASCVDIVDDPLAAHHPRAFDAEGTPSRTTSVVQNGVFQSFLHNLKTAAKEGCASTSNASRAAAGSPVTVAPSNFFIAAGEKTQQQLLAQMGDGILICTVSGLHAGLNAVTGDFSLLASGFVVKDGQRGRPVEQVTVAGNFLKLLPGVLAVGSDLFFSGSQTGSPSLLIDTLTVSGSGEQET